MSNQRNITDTVRALAPVFGDTSADLAAVLGLSESSVAGKRSGRANWTLKDVEMLAEHYGITIEQVMSGPRAWLGLAEGGGGTRQYHPDAMGALAA